MAVSPHGTNSLWMIPFQSKQTMHITFTFERLWHAFLVGATIVPSTAMTALLLQHRSRTPKFHNLWWNFSESFHQHSNDQTAPNWMWHGSLFVHLSADVAQILRQHDASSVCRSKSGGTNFCRFLLLQQLHGQLGDDFGESKQELSQRDRRPLTWKAVQIWGRLRWTFCPIWNIGTTRDIAYGSNNPLRKIFSQFETEFDANTLLLKIFHVSTCKKWPRVLNTHSIKHTSLDD